ncbi:cytochrome ubiquinol oxidase subunit I [Paraburkholderia sp. MM6662-R1]|uniref:cytochrome ubiquinol oxidase subunit I n=2 Tax=unclassified Paraburkholderia TaxID=2615204 RepID=UPI003D262E14
MVRRSSCSMSGHLSLPRCDGNCCSSVQAVLHPPWIGTAAALGRRLQKQRWLLWPVAWSFPLGFIAILAGWFTAEVGRQPWAVWGVLRTANALTPGLLRALRSCDAGALCCGLRVYLLLRHLPRPSDRDERCDDR